MDIMCKEMKRVASLKTEQEQEKAQKKNDAPCTVCGSTKFVQKFRNVVGEISGSMCGYFSLFGGSVNGSINGYTKTLPVLSCRECENEREIATWEYVFDKNVFYSFMHDFYFSVKDGTTRDIDPFFLERPVETRKFMLDNRNYEYTFYNDIPYWDTEIWAKAGFKINKIQKKFLFFKWKRYPTWEELESPTS